MAGKDLFDQSISYDNHPYRNIVFSPDFETPEGFEPGKGVFDDLADDPSEAEVAAQAAGQVTRRSSGLPLITPPDEKFLFSAVNSFPFMAEPAIASRFSDGSFGVWYGAEEWMTTIWETGYHMVQNEEARERVSDDEVITRYRMIYQVDCRAILVDFRGKEKDIPEIIGDDYAKTRKIGQTAKSQGAPGIITPSARCRGMYGTCLAIFSEKFLSNPKIFGTYTYTFKRKNRKFTAFTENQGSTFAVLITAF